jgi:hypothetical protein
MRFASVRWRRGLAFVACVAGVLSIASPAFAAWSAGGSGAGKALALTMPSGATPTASAAGSSVTVSWPAAKFANGTSVAGYVITRYNTSGVAQTIGSGCSGVVTTLTCTELSVPSGTWTYTDTPVQSNWRGSASAMSNSVQV